MRRVSEADLGKGQMLRFKAKSADKGSMVSVVRENASREARRRERESGQALVEFALIVPLFLVIVVGDHPVRRRRSTSGSTCSASPIRARAPPR